MKIEIHRNRCIRECKLCFEACPKITQTMIESHSKDELMEFFHSSYLEESTKDNCPNSAFEKNQENALKINEEKCSDCKQCIEESNGKILHNGLKPVKCDLCTGQEDYLCVKACPYQTLSIQHTEKEKEELKEKIGYRINPNKGEYEVNEENFSIQEARIIHQVLKEIREKNEEIPSEELEAEIEKICLSIGIELTENHIKKLKKYIEREMNGLSILDPLIKNEELEEISIIGPNKPIYIYHAQKGWIKTNLEITNPEKIKNLINKTARKLNRRITLKKPRINANINKGRIHGAIKPLATTGNCLTIRKFITDKFKPKDLIKNNTITPKLMNTIEKTVKCDTNILIAGNTGSGKTTTLNTLLNFLPETERIVIVEETPEVNPPQNHTIRLTTSPSLNLEMHELVTDTLRMRPDRVIIGEVRSKKEAKSLINTMLAGQGKGSIATFHGNSSQETITRLKSLGIPENDIKAIDLILIQRRWINHAEHGKEERQIIQASTINKKGKSIDFYTKKEGINLNKLKKTNLMDKLKLSYNKTSKEIIKDIRDRKWN